MSWIKIDDRLLDHPKFVRLEALAPSRGLHLWVGLMSYAKQQLTDGRVPRDMLRKVQGPHYRWRQNALDALVAVGLVEVSGDDLLIHDYLDWNPSRQKILGPPRGETDRATHERDASDNGATTERERTDNAPRAQRQHIKGGKVEGLSVASLTRARAESESESESESDQIPLVAPQMELPSSEAAASQSASTSEATPAKPKKTRASRAPTQCPADLKPDATTDDTAWELGFSQAQLELERKRCIDWARSKTVMRADWQATLRNWLRKSAEERGLKPRGPRDERWASYQQQLAKAKEPVKHPVPAPAGYGQRLGSIGA